MSDSRWFLGTLILALTLTGSAWAQGGEEGSGDEGEEVVEIQMTPAKEQHFRIGLNGYAGFDTYGDDAAAMKIGAAVVAPHFDVIIKYGLGIRLGFVVHYNSAAKGSIKGTGQVAGVDLEWYEEYENPDTVQQARVPGHIFSYGMGIAFKYEVTVPEHTPAYRFFRWVQPYLGVGVVLSWTRTHTDIPKEMSVLIENEAYRGADPESEYDPWAIQFGPGFDLFGGFHFNVARKFRINIEVGYYLVEVPDDEGAALRYATEGHHAHHLGYKVNTVNLGGGLEWKF